MSDSMLTQEEVRRFTGHDTPRTQSSFLKKQGIKHIINAKKEVILTWGWINGINPDIHIHGEQPDFRSLKSA